MPHSYSQVFVHIVFSTSGRENLIKDQFKVELYGFISDIISKDFKSTVVAINGTQNHIHILIKLNPLFALANLVKNIKGNSSHWLNQKKYIRETFTWQEGYGAFSVSPNIIKKVISYINNQEEHHLKMTFDDEVKKLTKPSGS